MWGIPSTTLTIVDSSPKLLFPPSIAKSIELEKSASKSCKLVPLKFPEILALGAASGTPAKLTNFFAILPLGIRTPTKEEPAVTILGTISLFFKMIVKGPRKKSLH